MKKHTLLFGVLSFFLVSCQVIDNGNIVVPPDENPDDKNVPTEEKEKDFPTILLGKTLIHDGLLDEGEDNSLYTINFDEEGNYTFYQDGGVGILASGKAKVYSNNRIVLDSYEGTYKGSKFESPSVTLTINGKSIVFTVAPEESEYVYLAYLGIYHNASGCSLVLERWNEYYFYDSKNVYSGSYDIYANGTISFTPFDSADGYQGTITSIDNSYAFSLTLPFTQDGNFNVVNPDSSFDAEHAMGTYTLSLYDDMFIIKRSDGYVKAMGSMKMNTETTGTATYFPRKITNYAEKYFTVSFTYENNSFLFPKTTPVLPTSGNFDENGIAGYYSSGSELYFEKTKEKSEDDKTTKYTVNGKVVDSNQNGVEGAEILLDGVSTGKKTASDGSYSIPDLTSHHFVTFKKNGYTIDMEEVTKDNTAPSSIAKEGKNECHLPDNAYLEKVMPTLGTARPLVLLVDFSDGVRPRYLKSEMVKNALFSLSEEDSLSSYYFRSSYGNLLIDGDVMDFYRMKHPQAYYESDKDIMQECLDYHISKGLDLNDYDADNDGVIDSLYVIWAGTPLAGNDIYNAAYRSTWSNSPSSYSKKITGYIFTPGTTVFSSVPPATFNFNSLIHETGHLLGLNDYYSYDTTDRTEADYSSISYTGGALEGAMGSIDMMDSNVGDQNPYSKYLLGWLNPTVIEYSDIKSLNNQLKNLRVSNLYADSIFVKLKESTSLYTELFVIDCFNTEGVNSELTRLGKDTYVRVLHVDAELDKDTYYGNWRAFGFKYDNSYTSTKFISLVEADGKDEGMNFVPSNSAEKLSYDKEDYFQKGDILSPSTYPSTDSYDDYGNRTVYTGLKIEVNECTNGKASLSLSYEEKKERLTLTSVSPTPTIVPYAYQNQTTIKNTNTTFLFTFSSAIEENSLSSIKIYTQNQQVSKSSYTTSINDSTLTIKFNSSLNKKQGYTIVLPKGIVKTSDGLVNNFNSIFGYLSI